MRRERRGRHAGTARWIAALALALAACSEPAGEAPPTQATPARPARPPLFEPGQTQSRDASPETLAVLLEDLEQPRHRSDGKGRAWIETAAGERTPPRLSVSQRATLTILFEAGPDGVAEGGAVYLQTSPFWGWDPPQLDVPEAPGFTVVTSEADGVTITPEAPGNHLLVMPIAGRPLAAGERIRIVYGAGPAGARVDRYAERESRLWIGVDGDGDGVRGLLPDSPWVEVTARPPVRMSLALPTTARPGERVRLTAALLDAAGNAGFPFEGTIRLEADAGLEVTGEVTLRPEDAGARTVEARVTREGLYRVRGTAVAADDPDAAFAIEAESNPLIARASSAPLCWADLHGHSELSDGSGTPEDYFAYARDVAGLDVAALTDHDHFGMRFLDANADLWNRIGRAVADYHEPGRFVTLLGYEWTSWIHGHRHVLYFDAANAEDAPVYSTLDPRYQTPAQLWDALRGRAALTFAHHSAGGAISTNWAFAPDPELEPVTEIVSIHGSSEALDSPRGIYQPVAGNFVRDAVAAGYRLGFIGSGDSHDGHPGLVQLANPGSSGGLAAIHCAARTREAVLAALRARHVYATNGPRIWLDVRLDDSVMGATHTTASGDAGPRDPVLRIEVVTPTPIDVVELIRGHELHLLARGEEARELSLEGPIAPLAPGESFYVRVVQEDGGAAWSSPIWAKSPPAPPQNSSSR